MGRTYKATLYDPESYLLIFNRYIELNPVRVGIVMSQRNIHGRVIVVMH
jgi:hypothetical protein